MAALAEVYRRFGESAAASSPLYERVAHPRSGGQEALRGRKIEQWARVELPA